jgi:hypothetical protein
MVSLGLSEWKKGTRWERELETARAYPMLGSSSHVQLHMALSCVCIRVSVLARVSRAATNKAWGCSTQAAEAAAAEAAAV